MTTSTELPRVARRVVVEVMGAGFSIVFFSTEVARVVRRRDVVGLVVAAFAVDVLVFFVAGASSSASIDAEPRLVRRRVGLSGRDWYPPGEMGCERVRAIAKIIQISQE